MPAFPGVDFLDFDSLLNDEELLARKTARQFVDEQRHPHHRKAQSRSDVSHGPGAAIGRAGIFRREPERLWLRGNVQRRLRPGDAGTGARRFRPAQLRFRAERAGDVSDLHVRLAGTKGQMAAAPAKRKSPGLLRPHRAAIRLESRRHADARRAPRRSLRAERRKNVDHQRIDRGCRPGLGKMRGRSQFAASWSKKAPKVSRPGTCTANFRCALPSPRAWR